MTITKEELRRMLREADRTGVATGTSLPPSDPEQKLFQCFDPDPSQSLWHYFRDLDHFKSLLTRSRLRLRRLDDFRDDTSEGTLSEANATGVSSLGQRLTEAWGSCPETDGWKNFINGRLRTITYVHCWFAGEAEDLIMWQKYGGKGCGVVVRTSVRRLREALCPAAKFTPEVCAVAYLPDNVPIPTIVASMAACRKRPNFAGEREHRVVIQLSEDQRPKSEQGRYLPTPDHMFIPVTLDRLLEAVYLGPNLERPVKNQLEALANAAAGSRVVRDSLLARFPGAS